MDIRGISSAASNAYAASLQESIRQESISWLALFESSSREIDINEAIIRAGSGHALFKEATVFNETMGGTLRYLKDQTAHMGHIITPEGTAMVNTGLGAMGYDVSGALHELPEPVKETFSSVYSAYITPHAATPNQRFFADAALGSAVSAVGGSVLKPPVPKPQKYVGVKADQISKKPVDLGKGSGKVNLGVDYKNFKTTIWKAPKGTKQTYKVHQRNDIDWDMVRTSGPMRFRGKTNREAALAGKPPELPDGNFVNLHHIGQNSKGALVEASTKYHNTSNKKAFRSLHNQHGVNKKHPEFPVKHDKYWKADVKSYWQGRAQNAK